jgi:uncharacterized protein YcfJ
LGRSILRKTGIVRSPRSQIRESDRTQIAAFVVVFLIGGVVMHLLGHGPWALDLPLSALAGAVAGAYFVWATRV